MPSLKSLNIVNKKLKQEEAPVNIAGDIANIAKPLNKKKKHKRVVSTESILLEEIQLLRNQISEATDLSKRALTVANNARTSALAGSSGSGLGVNQVAKLVDDSVQMAINSLNTSPFNPQVNPGLSEQDNDTYKEYTGVTSLLGHKVVRTESSGSGLFYADCTDVTHAESIIGLTTNSGTTVKVLFAGDLTETSWNYTPGSPIYLGENGNLVETIPTNAKFVLLVGRVVTSDTIVFNFGNPPIILV